MANSRRGKFRRHLNSQYGRMKRNNRFSHFYNKVYIPSNWSVSSIYDVKPLQLISRFLSIQSYSHTHTYFRIQEAPDETAPSNTNADNTIESNDEKPTDGTPTIEQCDVSGIGDINKFVSKMQKFNFKKKTFFFVILHRKS